ncbi:MAG: EAL domain-containing protein [Prochlorotrichaceae cyanobacterium]
MSELERQAIRHFLVIEDSQGKRLFPLRSASYSLGRDSRNSILLNSKSVSRQHALLLRITLPDSDQYLFRVLDGNLRGKRSTNGLFINGERSTAHDLRHGDLIEFGTNDVIVTYHTLTNLSDLEYQSLCKADNPISFLEEVSDDPATVIATSLSSPESREASLMRLASFPELMSNPIVEMDPEGNISYINPAATELFPELRQEGLRHPVLDDLLPVNLEGESIAYTRVVRCGQLFFEQAINYLPTNELIRIVMTDITARKEAETALEKRDRLLRAISESSSHLLRETNYTLALQETLRLIGESMEVDRVCLYENHPHPDSGEVAMSLRQEWVAAGVLPLQGQPQSQNQSYAQGHLQNWYSQLQADQTLQPIRGEDPQQDEAFFLPYYIQSALIVPIFSNLALWGHLSVHDCQNLGRWSAHEESGLRTVAANISAVLQRQQVEEANRYRANHDLLTGLLNRSAFDELLINVLRAAQKDQNHLSILFLDLDRFKEINDRWGHSLGDQLLKAVSSRLQSLFEAPVTIARWRGDEFILLLPNVSAEAVPDQAKLVLDLMDPSFQLRGKEFSLTTSIGITSWGPETSSDTFIDAETLVRQADIALYKAKALGRSSYAIYQPADRNNEADLDLEQDLHHALERREFHLLYQPQVNLINQKIMGIEALLRWKHPTRGLISPGIFIPIAEERGWIGAIGTWVLRTACTQAKIWQNQGYPPVTLSVNLSLKQFRSPHLVQEIADILAETELAPKYLELEVTESTAVQDLEYTQMILQQLNDLGLRLSIDDFGTGYSSLNRLQKLPLHTLKIDQSFVREIAKNPKVSHIIAAIVSLGRSLNLDLIAEGVELPEQMEFLKSIDCDTAQGYFFHRPLLPEDITAIFQAGQTASSSDPLA